METSKIFMVALGHYPLLELFDYRGRLGQLTPPERLIQQNGQ